MMKDATDNEVLERLAEVIDSRSATDFSQALEISVQAVYKVLRGKKVPNSWVYKIAKKFQVSPEWLFHGMGKMRPEANSAEAHLTSAKSLERVVPSQDLRIVECESCELAMIPMVEARLSAGGGSFETEGAVEEYYAFRTDWLRRKGQTSKMVLMRVDGDSMEPAIASGDAVLIDQSQNEPRPGLIYAVAIEDMIYLKEVNAMPGKLILSSFNEQYPPIEVQTQSQAEDTVKIIGRAIWWCHEA